MERRGSGKRLHYALDDAHLCGGDPQGPMRDRMARFVERDGLAPSVDHLDPVKQAVKVSGAYAHPAHDSPRGPPPRQGECRFPPSDPALFSTAYLAAQFALYPKLRRSPIVAVDKWGITPRGSEIRG